MFIIVLLIFLTSYLLAILEVEFNKARMFILVRLSGIEWLSVGSVGYVLRWWC